MQHRMRKMAVATLVAIGAVVVSDAALADAEPAANSGSSHFDPRLPIMPGTQLRATELPAADPYAVHFWETLINTSSRGAKPLAASAAWRDAAIHKALTPYAPFGLPRFARNDKCINQRFLWGQVPE